MYKSACLSGQTVETRDATAVDICALGTHTSKSEHVSESLGKVPAAGILGIVPAHISEVALGKVPANGILGKVPAHISEVALGKVPTNGILGIVPTHISEAALGKVPTHILGSEHFVDVIRGSKHSANDEPSKISKALDPNGGGKTSFRPSFRQNPRSPGAWPCSGGFPLLGCRSAAPREPLDLDPDEDILTVPLHAHHAVPPQKLQTPLDVYESDEDDVESEPEEDYDDASQIGSETPNSDDDDESQGPAMDLCGFIVEPISLNSTETSSSGRSFDITVDSGAGKSVMPPDAAPDYALQTSAGQLEGQHFVGAGGDRIKNLGQKVVPLHILGSADDQMRCATFHVAQVRKPLMAVSASCDAGHLCLFDNDGSFLIVRDSAEGREIRRLAKRCVDKMALERRNGVYVLPTTIVAPERLTPQARSRTQPKSSWKSASVDQWKSTAMEVDAVFHRQGR